MTASPSGGAVGPELVFAVARPVGTPDAKFYLALDQALHAYGYKLEHVKLSKILGKLTEDRGDSIDVDHEESRISQLMDAGDHACERAGSEAAVAIHGVVDIRERRVKHHSPQGQMPPNLDLANEAIPRIAWVIDSLKRPAEVTMLRSTYGDHLLTVGLQASTATRQSELKQLIRLQRASLGEVDLAAEVTTLIDRDLKETGDHGQNVLKTFPMSDVFIDMDGDVGQQVDRVLDLLFGNPDYQVPTQAEYGMQLAYTSSTRSPELGLKVGAALATADGGIISLGVNAHPAGGASPFLDESSLTIRDLLADTIRNLGDTVLGVDQFAEFVDDPDQYCQDLLVGPLKDARIRDLTEFQLTVHAEMSALLSALGSGHDVRNSMLYVTAYPCHNCAKHLLSLGIKVVYLEPYPKSRAGSMYGADIEGLFHPFTGIAPRRYQQLFEVPDKRKNPDGSRMSWTPDERKRVQPRVDSLLDQRGIADREASVIQVLDAGGARTESGDTQGGHSLGAEDRK